MSSDNDSLGRDIQEQAQQMGQMGDVGRRIAQRAGTNTGAGSTGAGTTGSGTTGTGGTSLGTGAGGAGAGAGTSAGTRSAGAASGAGSTGGESSGIGTGASAGAGGAAAVSGSSGGAAAGGGTTAAGAAGGAAGASAALPIVIVVACALVFVLIFAVLTVGTPSTSLNSWTHVTEEQDPIDEDELEEDGSPNGFADGRAKAIDAEAEGVNLVYRVLKEEEIETYDELKKACTTNGVDYETTKAFMTKAGKISEGNEIFEATAGQKDEKTGWGYYTQDQIEACEILAAYSISVDNLWDKEYLGDDQNMSGINLDDIDISDTEGKAKYMYAALRNVGYSHNAACGVLGNIEQESGFSSTVVNSIGASGIVQWLSAGRKSSMKSYVTKKYGTWTDYKGQVEFMIKEIKSDYKEKVYKPLMKSNVSLYDATWVVLRHYEIPGNFIREQQTRLANAKKWSEKFRNMSFDTSGNIDNRDSGTATKVQLGEARTGERGLTGNTAGDQTGGEVAISNWYTGSWTFVVRIRDFDKANKAAKAVKEACENNNIGYDQAPAGGRGALNKAAKKQGYNVKAIRKKLETSCTPLVCMGINASGIPIDPTSSAEEFKKKVKKVNKKYKKKGMKAPFIIYTKDDFTKSKKKLRKGDILCTGHHSAMVVYAKVKGAKKGGKASIDGWTGKSKKGKTYIGEAMWGNDGNPGDQGNEVGVSKWRGGWEHLWRPKDPEKALRASKIMYEACKGDTVGYDNRTKKKRLSFYEQLKKHDGDVSKMKKCDTACSQMVASIYKYLGVKKLKADVDASGLHSTLKANKKHFEHITSGITKNSVQPGDILLITSKGSGSGNHAVMVVKTKEGLEGVEISSSDTENPKSKSKKGSKKGIKGALKWAKKIADDDSYVYGGSRCHTCSGTAKQYVCTTFVKAAYAHGAGDKEMLKWCKAGRYGYVDDLEAAIKKSKNWKHVGKFDKSKLRAGDVVFKGGQHVVIYYGNNKVVHASGRGKGILLTGWYPDRWTNIYRYVGKGGKATNNKRYKKYTCIKKITKDDLKVVSRIGSIHGASAAQSFAYKGKNTYAVALTNPGAGEHKTSAYIALYKKSRRIKSTKNIALKIVHANGLAYNSEKNELYSVSGFGSKKCRVFDAKSLTEKKTINMEYSAGSICYDETIGKFTAGTSDVNRVYKGRLKKVEKTIDKKGTKRRAQDLGGKDGVIYNCIAPWSGGNSINMYSAITGGYLGSYEVPFGEIQSIDIDEEGHLLILIYQGAGNNTIYKTKEALALAEVDDGELDDEEGGEGEEEEGEPGNWRRDMPNRLRAYMQSMKAEGKEPLYELYYVIDEETGKPREYTGIYNVNTLEDDPTMEKEAVPDGKVRGVTKTDTGNKESGHSTKKKPGKRTKVTTNKHKIRKATKAERKKFQEKRINNTAQTKAAQQAENKRKKPKLKRGDYIKATMKKKNVAKLGFEAFGVTNEKVEELYGSYTAGTEAVEDMALNSLALLHNVNSFDEDYRIEPEYKENGTGLDAEEDALDYELKEVLGSCRVYFVCGCGKQSCTKHRVVDLGISKIPKRMTPGVSCWTSNNRKFPKDAIIHTPHLGCLVIDGKIKQKGKKPYLVLYLGKDHKKAKKMMNYARRDNDSANRKKKSSFFEFRLVEGVTPDEVKDYGNNVSGIAGGWLWPVPGHTNITSGVGPRWGRQHQGIDIAVPEGTKVRAARKGTVTRASFFDGYGNCVDIDHGNGWMTRYGHLSSFKVEPDDEVNAGEIIALSGNTGRSTGPHLHFEIRKNDSIKDPEEYVKPK